MKKVEWLIAIIFSSTGLVFLVAGISLTVGTFKDNNDFVEHRAVITRLQQYRNSEGELSHLVYIEYKINGVTYNQYYDSYKSSMRTGQEVIIYYDPDSPERILASGGKDYLVLIFPGMGALFFILGASMAGVKIANTYKKKKLKAYGDLINAEFVEAAMNTKYSVNSNHPYNVFCRWTDSSSQTEYSFKSENIWYDPLPAIEAKGITSFPVYIEKHNPKKYYISLDCLQGV